MAKCEDCICFKSCQAWCVAIDKALKTDAATEELQKNNAELCPSFKNTADVVEVVRCKDCSVPHNKWTGCPNLNGLIPPPNFYCAKGERSTDNG